MWGWIISQLLLFKSLKQKGHAARRTNGNHEAQGFPAPHHPPVGEENPWAGGEAVTEKTLAGTGGGPGPPGPSLQQRSP